MIEKDRESSKAITGQVKKVPPLASRTPTMEQIHTMNTDDLVRLLLGPEMTKPVNAPMRQQIIKILQERKGNSFVQSLLGGKTTGGK